MKPTRFLVLLVATLLPLSARAQNNVALRSGPGVQFTCSATPPVHVSTRGMFWCKSTDSNKLYYTDPSGSSSSVGLGTNVSLVNSYLNGLSQADSTITYDSTRNWIKILDASSTLGTLFQARNNADSLTWVSFTSNSQHFLRSGATDGASAVGTAVDTNAAWSNATSKPFRVLTGGVERFSVTGPGNLRILPAAALVSASQGSTNTVGMILGPNVADGASSVGLSIDLGTALSSGQLFRLRNVTTTLWTAKLNNTDGVFLADGGGSSVLGLSTNAGTTLCYGSACYTAGSGSLTLADGTGTAVLTGGVLTLTISQGLADADGTRNWGTLAKRWSIVGAKRLIQGMTVQAFSATPTINCTNGNAIHFGPVTANITSVTMTAGSAGETCKIVFQKDNSAGAYTITTYVGAVKNGTATFPVAGFSRVVETFMWDSDGGDGGVSPTWVEVSRNVF